MSVNFQNTETAFQHYTNSQLKNAALLFRFITKPTLVRIGKILYTIALKLHIPVKWAIKPTLFRHFCGGETISECEQMIHALAQSNVATILDYSAEGLEDEQSFDHVRDVVKDTLQLAQRNQHIRFGVFKFTGMCYFNLLETISEDKTLNQEQTIFWNNAVQRAKEIFNAAVLSNIPVYVDAEETWIQPAIDTMINDLMLMYNKKTPIVFTTIQMYRADSVDKVKSLIDFAKKHQIIAGVKLVRGAYMEKERDRANQYGYPTPIHSNKQKTDESFNTAVKLCLEQLNYVQVCIATHNEESCLLAVQCMNELSIPSNDNRVWFSQLLGMSDHITFNLSADGYNVSKYVPFGPLNKVMPYLIRRAEENSSVQSQSNREMRNIQTELRRRKHLMIEGN